MPINADGIKLGVIMDPIAAIHFHKDTTLALLIEAQKRNWQLYYMKQSDLYAQDGVAVATMQHLRVYDDANHWYDCIKKEIKPLHELDVVLMRKDPPFDLEYIYTTYLLELAEAKGTLVVNRPQSLRDANEKFFTSWFPQCTPKSLISRDAKLIHEFINNEQDVILKPLDAMGGSSIFRVTASDYNINVIIETITQQQTRCIMAQCYIPEIKDGDKRIFLIDGKPVPYALARIPQPGDIRGNLAADGKGVGVKLNARDYWICEQVGPTLREKGLMFVGIDVIGDYLTEINVTSPTCVREIENYFDINISALFLDLIERKLISDKKSDFNEDITMHNI